MVDQAATPLSAADLRAHFLRRLVLLFGTSGLTLLSIGLPDGTWYWRGAHLVIPVVGMAAALRHLWVLNGLLRAMGSATAEAAIPAAD